MFACASAWPNARAASAKTGRAPGAEPQYTQIALIIKFLRL
jgi:hypothetical protein